MILKDYHMHTNRCDGTVSAEEMVKAAVRQGLVEIGFSEHSHTDFDDTYCLTEEGMKEYCSEILALREKYADQISIKLGLEMDLGSDADTEGLDYWIGSVHYVKVEAEPGAKAGDGSEAGPGGEKGIIYIPVDESGEIQREAADRYFGGDIIAFAEEYFEAVGTVAEKTRCTIIGHFDLVAKFNEKENLFDEEDPRYVVAWKKAVDRLIPSGVPFEINTGAMSRGLRSQPYPSDSMREYIREQGGSFILSSDSHRTDTLCFKFDDYESEVSGQ